MAEYTNLADITRQTHQPDESPLTHRQLLRLAIVEQLLTALRDVIWRYRTLGNDGELTNLCAEAVTAEVAHHLYLARTALHRQPLLTPELNILLSTTPATPPSGPGAPDPSTSQ